MADLARFPRWPGDRPDDHHLSQVQDDFWERFTGFRTEAFELYGVRVLITRAWASFAEQDYLYQGWLKRLPGFNPAAPPGSSFHERGLALDTNPGWEDVAAPLRALAAKWGLHYPLGTVIATPHEDWHLEPMYARGYKTPHIPVTAPPEPPSQEDDDMPLELMLAYGGHVIYAPSTNIATVLDRIEEVRMFEFAAAADPRRVINRLGEGDLTKGIRGAVKLRTDGQPFGQL